MAMNQKKTIINCAITGSIHTPTMSEYLPITPAQISSEGLKAATAGAGTVHIHVRNPQTGQPSSDLRLFREVFTEIHQRSDVVQCTTTGGGIGMTPKERVAVVRELEPELASMNIGSMNYGTFLLSDRIKDFKFDWEKSYLESTRDWVYSNTFHSMEVFFKTMKDCGTKPELECYDIGHIYTVAYMAEQGFIEKPYYFQFILGILGGIGPSIDNLLYMKNTADKLFGEDYIWSILPVGRFQFPLCAVAAVMGGNVRVGMEDNLFISKGKLLTTNEEAVIKIRNLIQELGQEIATPEEVRKILNLKGKHNTKIKMI